MFALERDPTVYTICHNNKTTDTRRLIMATVQYSHGKHCVPVFIWIFFGPIKLTQTKKHPLMPTALYRSIFFGPVQSCTIRGILRMVCVSSNDAVQMKVMIQAYRCEIYGEYLQYETKNTKYDRLRNLVIILRPYTKIFNGGEFLSENIIISWSLPVGLNTTISLDISPVERSQINQFHFLAFVFIIL